MLVLFVLACGRVCVGWWIMQLCYAWAWLGWVGLGLANVPAHVHAIVHRQCCQQYKFLTAYPSLFCSSDIIQSSPICREKTTKAS